MYVTVCLSVHLSLSLCLHIYIYFLLSRVCVCIDGCMHQFKIIYNWFNFSQTEDILNLYF